VRTVPLFVLSDLATYTAHRNFLYFTILSATGTSINHTITRRLILGIDQKVVFLHSCRANDKIIFFLRRCLQFFFFHFRKQTWWIGTNEHRGLCVAKSELVSFKFALKLLKF
jgi:hypothetical protein